MDIGEDIHHLELVPLDDRSWRLCDHGPSGSSPEVLFAYIETLRPNDYEALWLHDGGHSEHFTSLEDILIAAATKLAGPSTTDRKPHPIPHFAPLRA